MRDSFGGVFMIRLLLVFIVIYVAFTAISLNYAKAFRIKNKVISFIEENDIGDLSRFDTAAFDRIFEGTNYNIECKNGDGRVSVKGEPDVVRYCYHGVMIEKKDKYIHYKVTTFVNWNLEFMNRILTLGGRNPSAEDVIGGTWAITGEATVVRNK